MKKILTITIMLTMLTSICTAQGYGQDYGKNSLEMSYGENIYKSPKGVLGRSSSLVNTTYRHMLTTKFGLLLGGQLDVVQSKKGTPTTDEFGAFSVSARLEGYLRVLRVGNLTTAIHAGAGGMFFWLKKDFEEDTERLANYIGGITVLHALTENGYEWGAVKLNYEVILNTGQDKLLDLTPNTPSGIDSYFQNISIGFVVYLDDALGHADWER